MPWPTVALGDSAGGICLDTDDKMDDWASHLLLNHLYIDGTAECFKTNGAFNLDKWDLEVGTATQQT